MWRGKNEEEEESERGREGEEEGGGRGEERERRRKRESWWLVNTVTSKPTPLDTVNIFGRGEERREEGRKRSVREETIESVRERERKKGLVCKPWGA